MPWRRRRLWRSSISVSTRTKPQHCRAWENSARQSRSAWLCPATTFVPLSVTIVYCRHLAAATRTHFPIKLCNEITSTSASGILSLARLPTVLLLRISLCSLQCLPIPPRKCHLYCVEKVTKTGTWRDVLSSFLCAQFVVTCGTDFVMSSSEPQSTAISSHVRGGH